ncbi:hypothetical protein SKAU_G00415340 [Synaphobranchus kaupii]|uniref:DDE Tnp4 domain-containing protein n=1 Tax=Synaphobranchus kaupii TaxID=118154 RepID=A0A9Q1IBH4_SYNKA|nr:hypothetical protein SKAU_G00415340 [Synaphobranchus kaupii]
MADKGFQIEKMLSEVGATLIIPPLKKSTQLSMEDTQKTQAIARLRILVERAIRRVKEYHIWDGLVPLSMYLRFQIQPSFHNACLRSSSQNAGCQGFGGRLPANMAYFTESAGCKSGFAYLGPQLAF